MLHSVTWPYSPAALPPSGSWHHVSDADCPADSASVPALHSAVAQHGCGPCWHFPDHVTGSGSWLQHGEAPLLTQSTSWTEHSLCHSVDNLMWTHPITKSVIAKVIQWINHKHSQQTLKVRISTLKIPQVCFTLDHQVVILLLTCCLIWSSYLASLFSSALFAFSEEFSLMMFLLSSSCMIFSCCCRLLMSTAGARALPKTDCYTYTAPRAITLEPTLENSFQPTGLPLSFYDVWLSEPLDLNLRLLFPYKLILTVHWLVPSVVYFPPAVFVSKPPDSVLPSAQAASSDCWPLPGAVHGTAACEHVGLASLLPGLPPSQLTGSPARCTCAALHSAPAAGPCISDWRPLPVTALSTTHKKHGQHMGFTVNLQSMHAMNTTSRRWACLHTKHMAHTMLVFCIPSI